MPDTGVLIGLLKWVAITLALCSTLWGLVAPKPNRIEIDGRKRWTASGMVTLTLVLAGATVGALSYRLETVLKEKSDSEQRLKQKARDALAVATEANTQKGLAQLGQARAEGRAEAARERVEALARETREVLRDVRLSGQVATGARENLARTGEALTQIERVVQPLETMTLTVTWEIPGDAPRMREVTARMAAGARIARAEWQRAWQAAYRVKPERPETLSLKRGDALYLDNSLIENIMTGHLAHGHIRLAIFAAGRSDQALRSQLEARQSRSEEIGDVRLAIPADAYRPIDYVIDTGAIRFTASATITPEAMGRTGAIISYPDLERASAIIWIDYMGLFFPPSRPVTVSLRSASRSYLLTANGMRRVPMDWPVFTLPRFTPGTGTR